VPNIFLENSFALGTLRFAQPTNYIYFIKDIDGLWKIDKW
jgi:hypothetical protein